MKTALLITTDDKFKTVKYTPGLKVFYDNIKTDIVQVVIPYGLRQLGALDENFIMVADEEALLKNNPKLNIFASTFYGAPIYGNVMIVKENQEDFEGLNQEDHDKIRFAMAKLLDKLEQEYHGN